MKKYKLKKSRQIQHVVPHPTTLPRPSIQSLAVAPDSVYDLPTRQLLVPPTRRTNLGDRSFPAAAARAWNTLPQLVQDAPSLPVFRRELRTVLFQSSFPAD